MSDINELLDTLQEGDPVTADQLLVMVYSELRRLASAKMAREMPGQTLQPTALVHEAWMRLGGEGQRWENRAHLFGAAAEAMRRILIDRAWRKLAARHGVVASMWRWRKSRSPRRRRTTNCWPSTKPWKSSPRTMRVRRSW